MHSGATVSRCCVCQAGVIVFFFFFFFFFLHAHGMADYRFLSTWLVEAPREAAWAVIENAPAPGPSGGGAS